MYEEIYNRVFKLQEECPELTISELCAKVIAQPAPKFYLTPGSAKVMVCKARKQWIQENGKDYGSCNFYYCCRFVIFKVWDWQTVGIYAGSDIAGRVLYPFFTQTFCTLPLIHGVCFQWFLFMTLEYGG